MGVDYWQRIIELERRQMRFDMNRQETETRLTQAQNRVNIVSSGSFARSQDQLAGGIVWANTIEIRLVSLALSGSISYFEPENTILTTISGGGQSEITYPPTVSYGNSNTMFTLSSQDWLFNFSNVPFKEKSTLTISPYNYVTSVYESNTAFTDSYVGNSYKYTRVILGADVFGNLIMWLTQILRRADNLIEQKFDLVFDPAGGSLPYAGTTGTRQFSVFSSATGQDQYFNYQTFQSGSAILELRWS